MIICKVSRRLSACSVEEGLERLAFVAVEREDGSTLVAADRLGVAEGSRVVVCQGTGTQTLLGTRGAIDAAVIARLDSSAPA